MPSHHFLPHVAERVFNTPLLMHPQKLDAIIAGLGQRVLGAQQPLVQVAAGLDRAAMLPAEMFSTRRGERTDRGWRIVDGVAVVSAMGALVHRTRFDADSTMLIGYNDLAADLEDAMSHPDVHAVLQVYDSPGGEVAGAFEHAERTMAMRGRKPMIAVADSMAASAAYLSASAADELVITSTGYAGSIGVVLRHVDFSKALAEEGIKVTHIFAGAHKVDGNPYEALPVAVRDSLQADIDGLHTMFVQAVALHRGMSEEAVRKTQAATYRGVAAVAAGLADRIGTVDGLINELSAQRTRSYPAGASSSTSHKATTMTTQPPQAAAGATAGAQPGAQTAAVPSTPAPDTAPAAAGQDFASGVSAERERVAAILGHSAAASHQGIAQQCIQSGLSAEQAAGMLAAAASSAAPKPAAGAGFAQHMASLGNPAVSGVEGQDASEVDAQVAAAGWGTAFAACSTGIPKPGTR